MAVLDMLSAPWAITPDMLNQIHAIYQAKLAGESMGVAELEAALGRPVDNSHREYTIENGVAVIPVHGVMAKRANMFQAISGGASTQMLRRDLDQALADPEVHSILLEFDSPGGAVDGLPEFASAIFNARKQKPIVSLASGLMASAAVWSGTAASEVYASDPATVVGSIGVVATHQDLSGLEKARGIKTTEIYAGKYKRIDSAYEPLTTEGRATIQARVDYLYGLFVDAVAMHRGVSVEQVLTGMADARLFVGQQAVDAGLIDGIKTRSEIIADLAARQTGTTIYPSARAKTGRASTQPQQEATMPIPGENHAAGTEPVAQPNQPATQPVVTLETIEKDHADIAQALRAQGATAELERVQAVMEQSMPGHETLINTLAFDGKTTGPEAAVQVLKAEREKRTQTSASLSADAPNPLPVTANNGVTVEGEEATISQQDPKALAAAASELVDAATAKGQKLSYSDAMRQVVGKK
jgi:capsid assembly protease